MELEEAASTNCNVVEDAMAPAFEEAITFGSVIETVSAGGDADVSVDKFPKDAVDEWPEPKKIHVFFFAKFRYHEDPKLKVKIDHAEKELRRRNQARYELTDSLRAKKGEKFQIIEKLKPLTAQNKEFRRALGEKKKEMEPLQEALGKLRAKPINGERGFGMCSSEEELNERIHGLQYRIQHESNTLVEEKQLLKDIKQLEATRPKVIAHAAMQAKIQDSFGQRETIQDHVKIIGGDMDEVRKEQQALVVKIKHLEDELKVIEEEISSLQGEMDAATQNKDKAYEELVALRKKRDDGNAPFFQYRTLQTSVRDLAARKESKQLAELSQIEMEKFMATWNSNKSFRDDYLKKLYPSLDARELSIDGTIRNPDEKPLVPVEESPAASEVTTTVKKPAPKRPKEDVAQKENDTVLNSKAVNQKADGVKPNETAVEVKAGNVPEVDGPNQEPQVSSDTQTRKNAPAPEVVDPAKLKEMMREEQMEKFKQAIERKKKLLEKAAAKEAIKEQKLAEKKLKEREKKARKKAGDVVNGESEEPKEDQEGEPDSLEPVEEKAEVPPSSKTTTAKENGNVRFRGRTKSSKPPIVRVVTKKKQAHSYWIWALGSLAAVVIMGLVYYGLQMVQKN